MSKKSNLIFTAALFIAAIVFFSFFRSAGSALDFQDSVFTLTSPGGAAYSIEYGDIRSLTLETADDYGVCVAGGSEKGCSYGLWENDLWGEYSRCTLDSVETVIVLTESSGSTLVFNYQNDNDTEAIYESFVELMQEKGLLP